MNDIDLGSFVPSAQRELSVYNNALNKADIVVTVSGGVVTSVRTRSGEESHVVVDYDNIELGRADICDAIQKLVDAVFLETRSTL